MALHRGIQSAIFYYLSCAPCTEASYRKKRRKEADRDRADKRALEIEQPGLYRHPSPFATNPNWQADIDLGPIHGPSTRRKKGERYAAEQWPNAPGSAGGVSKGTNSLDLDGRDSRNDSKINMRRYQRQDEDLWGAKGSSNVERPSTSASNSVLTRPPTARTVRTDKSAASYQTMSNPPINDLHPAIVTRMDSSVDALWMLQPPPAAKVMLGREPANRSRSDSGGSRLSSRRGGADSLSRQLSARLMEEKMRSRDTLEPPTVSRGGSQRSKASADNNERVRRRRRTGAAMLDGSSSDEDDARTLPPRRLRLKTASSLEGSLQPKTSSTLSPSTAAAATSRLPRGPARKTLPTITSTSSSSRTPSHNRRRSKTSTDFPSDFDPASSQTRYTGAMRTSRLPTIIVKDSSLAVLQELAPNSHSVDTRSSRRSRSDIHHANMNSTTRNSKALLASPTFEARISLPPPDKAEVKALQQQQQQHQQHQHQQQSQQQQLQRTYSSDLELDKIWLGGRPWEKFAREHDDDYAFTKGRRYAGNRDGAYGDDDGIDGEGDEDVLDGAATRAWFTRWAAENVRREVTHRWSVEF